MQGFSATFEFSTIKFSLPLQIDARKKFCGRVIELLEEIS